MNECRYVFTNVYMYGCIMYVYDCMYVPYAPPLIIYSSNCFTFLSYALFLISDPPFPPFPLIYIRYSPLPITYPLYHVFTSSLISFTPSPPPSLYMYQIFASPHRHIHHFLSLYIRHSLPLTAISFISLPSVSDIRLPRCGYRRYDLHRLL